ncbi:MAG: Sensor protein [Rhodospirillales bacterium]|nr:Sensor protein [Rhodospirillales bacterium]
MRGKRLSLSRAIIAAGTIVAALMLALALGAILKLHDDALVDADRELVNVARIVGERVEQTVAAADFALLRLTSQVEDFGAQDIPQLGSQIGTRAFYDELRQLQTSLGQIEVVSIIGADGTPLASSREYPAPTYNLADRVYLQQLRDNPLRKLYVSGPLRSRHTNNWIFYIVRPIRNPVGEFLAAAVVGIAAGWIERSFATIDVGADTATVLFTAERELIARWPHNEAVIGQKAANRDLRVPTTVPQRLGYVRGFDGQLRLATGVDLDRYPLIIGVSRSLDGALEDWRTTAALISSAIIAALVIILGLTLTGLKLARRDAQSANALAESEAQLKRAMQAKSDFLSNMSHELRSPLTVIIGFAKLIDSQTRGPIPAEYAVWARDIIVSGEHLLALVNDILDLSKIEAGALDLDEAPTSILSVLRQAIRMHGPQAESAGVTLNIDDRVGDIPVLADERRLLQVVINLMTNAIKYTPSAGTVTIEFDRLPSGEPSFTVADTGIGIAPDDIERVMARFVQLKEAGARRAGGTGIGLPLARELVELHGGKLILTSEPGHGTRAQVVLPLSRVLTPPRVAVA